MLQPTHSAVRASSARALVRSSTCLLLALLPAAAPANPEEQAAAREVEAHTRFLADDLLEGRGTGTRGYALAARYVASQFARIGLVPAGDDGGYEQALKLAETRDDLEAGRFSYRGKGPAAEFEMINEALVRAPAGQTEGSVTAPAVFVGHGVEAPELRHDDFAGVDLRGRIAVVLSGAPPTFPADQRAHYSNSSEKNAQLVRRGAIGVVTIVTPRDEARYAWPFYIAQGRFPRMRLLDAQGGIVEGFPELRASAVLKRAAGETFLAAAGRAPAEVFASAERGEVQSGELGLEVSLAGRATVGTVESANVLGLLPGTDLTLAERPIVITAHLDHIGIGPEVAGDTIYNGAMDNAIGVGLLLALADELARQPAPLRPVLFAAVTAEEKGLLGAEHLARTPPAGVRTFAANVNLDMALFPAPVRDVIAWGAEHSSLGAVIDRAAREAGFTVSPDPMPDEVVFVRSDQYAFVRTGVPAVFLGTGQRSTDPAVDLPAAWTGFLRERYHKPGDDLSQPIDWPSVGAFSRLSLTIVRTLADSAADPAWLPGDFFGERFSGRDGR